MEMCVKKLVEIGVRVSNVTCDSPKVNISMFKKLGARVDCDNPDMQILKDMDGPPIYGIHDNVHSVKNVRNTWGSVRLLKNAKGEVIDWDYIVKLHELQSREQLRCANKLTDKHVNFKTNKMKVSLAVQTLSNSVANSLKFCREVLKLPEFKESEPTEEFIRKINNVFDLFNTRSSKGFKYTSPLKEQSKFFWLPVLEETKDYIMGLTNGWTGKSMVKDDPKKTGFLAYVCNIVAIKAMYSDLVLNGPLQFILTYKLCQDPLEHFFGLIRARFGSNNNPTPLQFKHTYRKIL